MSRGFIASALALIFVFVSVGCDQGQPVTVWADPALKTALDEIAPRFRREHRAGLEAEYKESVALKEADDTNYPDVILAVEPVVQELTKSGALDESTSRTFAGDLL